MSRKQMIFSFTCISWQSTYCLPINISNLNVVVMHFGDYLAIGLLGLLGLKLGPLIQDGFWCRTHRDEYSFKTHCSYTSNCMREILLAANYEDRCEACQPWQSFDANCELEQVILQQLNGCKRAKKVHKSIAHRDCSEYSKLSSCCITMDLVEVKRPSYPRVLARGDFLGWAV